MGGGQSKKDQVIAILNEHKLLKDGVVTQKEFVAQIFQKLDNNQAHTQAGPLVVTDSHVLHALYDHLAANNRNLLPKSRVIEVVEKIYDKPEKSIECTLASTQIPSASSRVMPAIRLSHADSFWTLSSAVSTVESSQRWLAVPLIVGLSWVSNSGLWVTVPKSKQKRTKCSTCTASRRRTAGQ